MAESWRALRTLKVLQAEQAAAAHALRRTPPPRVANRPQPSEPEREVPRRPEYAPRDAPLAGRTLNEAIARPGCRTNPSTAGRPNFRIDRNNRPDRPCCGMRARESQGRMAHPNKSET